MSSKISKICNIPQMTKMPLIKIKNKLKNALNLQCTSPFACTIIIIFVPILGRFQAICKAIKKHSKFISGHKKKKKKIGDRSTASQLKTYFTLKSSFQCSSWVTRPAALFLFLLFFFLKKIIIIIKGVFLSY
jgi:hypothetical protein